VFQFWVVFEIEFFGCTWEPEMLKKLIFNQNSKMYNYMHRSFALLCIFLFDSYQIKNAPLWMRPMRRSIMQAKACAHRRAKSHFEKRICNVIH
jgi:hypothetical protein